MRSELRKSEFVTFQKLIEFKIVVNSSKEDGNKRR